MIGLRLGEGWSAGGGYASLPSFPSGPADGEEFTYAADNTNGVMWRLKYRAGSASALKWEFVGGSPLWSGPQGSVATVAGAAAVALTGGPSITVPRTGDYWLGMQCFMQASAAGLNGLEAAFARNGVAQTSATSGSCYLVTQATFDAASIRVKRAWSLTAGDVLTMLVSSSGAAGNFQFGLLDLTPIRAS